MSFTLSYSLNLNLKLIEPSQSPTFLSSKWGCNRQTELNSICGIDRLPNAGWNRAAFSLWPRLDAQGGEHCMARIIPLLIRITTKLYDQNYPSIKPLRLSISALCILFRVYKETGFFGDDDIYYAIYLRDIPSPIRVRFSFMKIFVS